MSMEEQFASYEAEWRNRQNCMTFGHLFPKKGKLYGGTLYVGSGCYGDTIILKECIAIEGSPWWFASVTEFVDNFMDKRDDGVFRIDVVCQVIEEKGLQSIEIKQLGHKEIHLPDISYE